MKGLELLALPSLCGQIRPWGAGAWVRAPSHSHDERVSSDGHWTSHKDLTHPEAKRTDRQTQNLPSCLSWSCQQDHTFASWGKRGELEPWWDQGNQTPLGMSGSLYFGSWLPPSEEVILVQEPKERDKGWPGKEGNGVGQVLERMVQKREEPQINTARDFLSRACLV